MTDRPREYLTVEVLSGYEPEIGLLLGMLEETRQRTRAALIDLTDADLDWVPGPEYNSIGTILYHLAAIEADWPFSEILEQPFPPEAAVLFSDDVRDDHDRLTVTAGELLEAAIDRLDAVRALFLGSFQAMSLPEFRRVRVLPDYDVTPSYVLHHLMQHEAEHRAELNMVRVLSSREPERRH